MSEAEKSAQTRRRQRRTPDGASQRDDGVDRGDGRTVFGTFPAGVSGNASGRPKGARNASTIAREVLGQTITMSTRNGPITLSKLEAAITQLVNCGLVDKNVRALERVIALGFSLEAHDEVKLPVVPLEEADRAVLALLRAGINTRAASDTTKAPGDEHDR